jgi:hypothetical protein
MPWLFNPPFDRTNILFSLRKLCEFENFKIPNLVVSDCQGGTNSGNQNKARWSADGLRDGQRPALGIESRWATAQRILIGKCGPIPTFPGNSHSDSHLILR